jgi:hypothetical protein
MPLYNMPVEVHDQLVTMVTKQRDAVVRKRKISGRERLDELDRLNNILDWLELEDVQEWRSGGSPLTDEELMARMRVTIPPKKAGRLELVRFTVEENDIAAEAFYGVRTPDPGEYTKLQEHVPGHEKGGILWMSDTPAELVDHLPAARKIADPSCRLVLINGLGLGCIAKLALSFGHVDKVYVVELDQRVIKIVGRWLTARYEDRVTIIDGSAYEVVWPSDEPPFDVVWHDIWPNISDENLIGMHQLHEEYRNHCRWQGSWALELCMMMQDVHRQGFQMVEKRDGKLPDETHKLWDTYREYLEVEHHYAYFVEQGYHAAPREGHPTPLDGLEDNVGRDGTIWRVDA